MNIFMRRTLAGGFTLIELLIVVAIIAILAAIAVPNFLEAQVRAKVSRAKSDMRTIAVGLESYAVDYNRGPIGGNEGKPNGLNLWTEDTRHYSMYALTTPVSYISTLPLDPFVGEAKVINENQGGALKKLPHYTYQYISKTSKTRSFGYTWYLRSVGPDKRVGKPYFSAMAVKDDPPDNAYDSTNGSSSYGDIYLTNKGFFTGSN